MILVFIVLGIIIIATMIVLALLLSTIRLEAKQFRIIYENEKWKIDFILIVSLAIGRRLKIGQLKIDTNKMQKFLRNNNKILQHFKQKNHVQWKQFIQIGKIEFTIEKWNLKGDFATIEPMISSYLYVFLHAILPIFIAPKTTGTYTNTIQFLNKTENQCNIEWNRYNFYQNGKYYS